MIAVLSSNFLSSAKAKDAQNIDLRRVTTEFLDVSGDGKRALIPTLGQLFEVSLKGGGTRRLGPHEHWISHGRYSPDSSMIAFLSNGDGSPQSVWLMDRNGRNASVIFSHPRARAIDLRWEGGGEALWVLVGDDERAEPTSLYRIDISTKRSELRYQNLPIKEFSISKDAVYVRMNSRISTLCFDRSCLPVPIQLPANVVAGPRLDSSGENKFFITVAAGASTLNTVSGTVALRLNDLDHLSAWEPMSDGKSLLAFANGRLVKIDIATGRRRSINFRIRATLQSGPPKPPLNPVDVTVSQAHVQSATLSADGRELAYTVLNRLRGKSFSTDAEWRAPAELGDHFDPSFSPQDGSVAFVAAQAGRAGHVFVRETDGEYRQLSKTPGYYRQPVWSGDGSRIAFLGETSRTSGVESADDIRDHIEVYVVNTKTGLSVISKMTLSTDKIPSRTPVGLSVFGLALNYDGTRFYYGRKLASATMRRGTDFEYRSFAIGSGDDRLLHHIPNAGDVVDAALSPSADYLIISRLTGAQLIPLAGDGTPENSAQRQVEQIREGRSGSFRWQSDHTLMWLARNDLLQLDLRSGIRRVRGNLSEELRADHGRAKVALVNAKIVPMDTDRVIDRGYVLIQGDQIVGVGEMERFGPLPVGFELVDLSGLVLIPGLIESHGHTFTHDNGCDRFAGPGILRPSLAFGITSFLELGGNYECLLTLKEKLVVGDEIGPRYFYVASTTPIIAPIASPEQAGRLVEALRFWQPTHLKAILYPRHDQRVWLRDAATAAQLRTTAEGGLALNQNLELVQEGYTAFEHWNYDAPVYEDVKSLLSSRNIIVTTTLTYAYSSLRSKALSDLSRQPGQIERLKGFERPHVFESEGLLQPVRRPMAERRGAQEISGFKDWPHWGIRLTSGSHNRPGAVGIHLAAWVLTYGGMSNFDALKTVTATAAQKIGIESKVGSIEVGKLADLLVLSGNPMDDIRNTTSIKIIMKGGIIYCGKDLRRIDPTAISECH